MKRGRKPKEHKRKRLHVYVREDLYAQFQLLNFNRQTGKASFGAFSDFVNDALKVYVEEQKIGN